ncbi:hypothetical protein FWC31_03280 [Candidatus Saccharibacteria bacterium]|nr:hypothetical protein [Candidatus Saccharibacteria bacterium]
MISQKKFSLVALILVVGLVLGGNLVSTHSVTALGELSAGSSLTLIPARYPASGSVELEPGKTYDGTLEVINDGSVNYAVRMSAVPFSVDTNYENNFQKETIYTQINRWTVIDETEFVLKSAETKEVHYHITVPTDVPAGGQYMAIIASTAPEATSGVGSVQSVASLFLATIAGDTRNEGEIVKNKINGYYTGGPIETLLTYKNSGNTDWTGETELIVSNFFGGAEIYHSEKPIKAFLLPETEYTSTLKWKDPPLVGLFHFTHRTELLGRVVEYKRLVLICPIWLIVLSVFVIIAIILLLVVLVKLKKKRAKQ